MPSSLRPQRLRTQWLAIAVLVLSCKLAAPQVSATAVPLLLPSAITYDSSGNLYIAELQRHAVRKVNTLGTITTVAGDGTQGFGGDGGPADKGQLNSPQGLAVDPAGNLYIADSGNNRVRRVDAGSGNLTTVAGNGRALFAGDGGPATAASLNLPRAICLDAGGQNLYIADSRNHRIRHIDLATGTIETVAGNGVQGFGGDGSQAKLATLDSPDSIALDTRGNLYIADTHNGRIRRIAADTKTMTTIVVIGSGSTSTASNDAPVLPRGLTSDAQGVLYIADAANHRILSFDPEAGALAPVAGGATQGFAGDGGPASTASLDSPRALALTPGGLVSIADSGNQRVRQISAGIAASPQIHTIAGLGAIVPGLLSLTAPTVITYGTGALTATLNTPQPASGQVTLLDVSGEPNVIVGTAALALNSATLSLSSLAVGQHSMLATYAGDADHLPAQTSTTLLTVSPQPVTARLPPLTMAYGSAVPVLTGTLDGVLARDIPHVSASFTTTVTAFSPPGAYPISVALTGAAAPNYLLQPTDASFVVTQANTSTSLSTGNADGSFTGSLRIQVNSLTSGTPSGLVALLDNGAVLAKTNLAGGSGMFAQLNLAPGAHVLTAAYAGDQNFVPSSSMPLSELVAAPVSPDFTLATTTPGPQTLAAGSSVTYTLSIQTTGAALSSPIALTVSGLPPFTTAAFSPAYIPPGATGATPVVLTITSTASSAQRLPIRKDGSGIALLALALPYVGVFLRGKTAVRRLREAGLLMPVIAFFLTSALIGCGDRVNTSGQGALSFKSYTLTVTGTATAAQGSALQHTATVVLQMKSSN